MMHLLSAGVSARLGRAGLVWLCIAVVVLCGLGINGREDAGVGKRGQKTGGIDFDHRQREPQQGKRAVTYSVDSIYFNVQVHDNLGNNVNVTFKDGAQQLLPTYVFFTQTVIQEVDPYGTIVANLTTPLTWSYDTGNTAAGNVSWISVTGNYSNGATSTWTYQVNQNLLPISFAGSNFDLSAGSFKFAWDIIDWPFVSTSNYLQVILVATAPNVSVDFGAITVNNATGGIRKIILPPVFTSGPPYAFNFLSNYLSDGAVAPVDVFLTLLGVAPVLLFTLTFTFGYAANSIIYDPDLGAILVTDNGNSGSGDGDGALAAEIGAPVGVFVALLVVVVVIIGGSAACYFFRRSRRRNYQARMDAISAKDLSVQED